MSSLLDDDVDPLPHDHDPTMALQHSSFTVGDSSSHHHHHDEAHSTAATSASNSTSNNKWVKNGFGMAVPNSSGKFTNEESEMIRRSIEEYCSAKGISTSRLCSECDHKAELKGAWMEISRRLPHRSVQSVYRHGIRQLHPFKRGAWSEEEVKMLSDLVQRLGKKWSAIQVKLHRSADACRDKYREMSDDYVKGRWKEPEVEQLKSIIREFLNVDRDTDMRDLGRMVEAQGIQIPWSAISKRMGKRSRLSCFKKWQKMTGTEGGAILPEEEVAEEQEDEPVAKRSRMSDHSYHHHSSSYSSQLLDASSTGNDHYDVYSAKIAAETVEAVDLPDVGDV
ncbi:hypothetical protein MPSEU_000359800 [Mayamaea pseudoterrestris]|nr:hypothetical protein MPSEU_000359800 [Mayamaea pseudoterrestris]